MTELTKDNYDNLGDDIDFIINTVMALPDYTHYDFIKGRLMRAYNQGRWDVYVEESNKKNR